MDISIIIPIYGVEAYIRECLQSVFEQQSISHISVECIVVNDCTKDRSMEIAREIISRYDGPISFKLIDRKTNGGLSAARNTGIDQSLGKYLYFLDSDDRLSPYCISSLWNVACKYPKANIVFGKAESFPDPEEYRKYFDFKTLEQKGCICGASTIRQIYLSLPEVAWNKLIQSEWLHQHDLLFTPGLINEDYDWHLRSYPHVECCAFSKDSSPTYYYRRHNTSIIAQQQETARKLNKLRILSDSVRTIGQLDKPFIDYFSQVIIDLRFETDYKDWPGMSADYKIARDSILSSVKGIPAHLLLWYLFLPKVIMKVKIFQYFKQKLYR